MESPESEEMYHVVCRECPVERLFETADHATTVEQEHVTETGHRVVVGRIT